jgi:hypothetical protein
LAYKNNIPKPTDALKDSQADLLANFAAIKTAWDINHVTFDLADEGKHNYVSFPEQGAAPAVAANEIAIYSKESTLTGVAELFVKYETGTEYEITAADASNPGYCTLASGLIMKWGTQASVGYDTIVFPVGADIPVFTTILTMQLTPYDNSSIIDLDEAIRIVRFNNPVQFEVFASNRTTTGAANVGYQYLAIGI